MAQWENVETHDYAGCCEGVHTHELVCTPDSLDVGTISSGVISSVHFNLHNELVKLYGQVGEVGNLSNQQRIELKLDILREIGYLSR